MNDPREQDPDGRVERALARWGQELDPAPAPPREEIWRGVRDGLTHGSSAPTPEEERPRPDQSGYPAARRSRRGGVLPTAVGMAAVLLLGIWLGRLSTPVGENETPLLGPPGEGMHEVAAPEGASSGSGDPAVRHLAATGRLLASLDAEPGGPFLESLRVWARGLLAEARFLLESPAAADPEVRALLQDLELLLVEVSLLPAEEEHRARVELDLIAEGIQRQGILSRIHALVPDTLVVSDV
jgi:hypothetical protein